MDIKITRDVLDGYLYCETKGYLKLAGQQGTVSDYQNLMATSRDEVRKRATETILSQYSEDEVVRQIPLDASYLARGPLFVLDVTLRDDQFALCFDGLKKVDGASKLGEFHFVPVLFHEGQRVRKEQRLLLDLCGLLLTRLQGRPPAYGIVYHGGECRTMRVRLTPDARKAKRLLDDVRRMQESEACPRLVLNDHCEVCEFRRQCHAQAMQEDNISLLRGMGERELRRYARKGIFTVTQAFLHVPPTKEEQKGEKARLSPLPGTQGVSNPG